MAVNIEKLLEKNPTLVKLIKANPDSSYKKVRSIVNRNITGIKTAYGDGTYISAHQLTWAIINAVEGSDSDLTLIC